MNKKKDTKIESKGDTIKVVLLIAVLIILLLAIGMVIYVNAIKPNKKIETPKHDEPTNEPSKQVEPNKVIEENNNEEIASVKVEIPTEKNGEPSYIEKNYTKENIPNNLLTVLKNLNLDSEVLPEGIGFESNYIINVNSKIRYVFIDSEFDSGRLCNLDSRKCYITIYPIKTILNSLSTNTNEEIKKVKVSIPTEKNGEPSYIEKNYTKENIPSNLSTMLENLKLDEEVLPYGIGFESSYIIDVNSKIKYVLLDSGKLCDLNSSNCYTSTYDVKNILDSLK